MMKIKICSLLLLFSIFELNLCRIQVDSNCNITLHESSVADFDDFTIFEKRSNECSQVLLLQNKKNPQCKYAVKEVRYLKKDASLPARNVTIDANAGRQTNSEKGGKFLYFSEEYVNDGIQVMTTLSDNPHFPRYYADFKEEHEVFVGCFIIMEYVEGINLKALIEREDLSKFEQRNIAAKLAVSIQEMHSLNIVHRFIEPSNVIYNKQTGKLTLVGFSLSKQLGSLDERMHKFCGNIYFLALEVANEKSYDYTVDWFAYGKTLLLLFGGTIEKKDVCIGSNQKVEISNNFNNIEGPLEDLILRCIDDKKEKRIRSLRQIKKHKYFKNFKWDTIDDEPNTVKSSVFHR